MQKIPFFKAADLDASIGVFFDGFSKVIVALSILAGTFALSSEVIFGTLMPGVVMGVLFLNGGLWYYYRQVAKKQNKPSLVAIPAGLQAGRIFLWLFSIMLPVFNATGDAALAYKVGVLANLIGGLVFVIGAYIMPWVYKFVHPAALFGAGFGGALAFLVLSPMDGMFKMPIVGWVSMFVLFVIYLSRMQVKIPAAAISIGVGAVIAWCIGSMNPSAVSESFTNLGFYIPKFTFDIFSADVVKHTMTFLPLIIIFSIGEVGSGIQAIEQGIKEGEDFNITKPLLIAGVANILSSFLGNPFALGMYWGYPAWKKINAGTGYHLGTVVIYALVGLTGLTAIINAVVPEATVLPILMFIGVSMCAQVFEVVKPRYYFAAVLAGLPIVIDFICGNAAEGAFAGLQVLRPGAGFIGMLLALMFVYIIDSKWINVTYTCIVAIGLQLVGMIHSPGVVFTKGYTFDMTFFAIYIITGVSFAVMHFLKVNQNNPEAKNPDEIKAKTTDTTEPVKETATV